MKKELTQAAAFKMLEESQKSGAPRTYRVRRVKLPNRMSLGHFKDIRQMLGLSQAALGNLLHTSVRNIQAYEQGARRIPGIVENAVLKMNSSPVFLSELQGRPLKPAHGRDNKLKGELQKAINEFLRNISKTSKDILKLKRQLAA